MATTVPNTVVTTTAERVASDAAEEEFFPKGAIAFFGTMLVAFGVIWLGLYFLLVQRQLWL